ncbi:MAG TPA: hypothetical protein VFL79_14620 [Terriglobia bacterium]|nr:hypothetical protein [Terriglobia bacterium]
MSDVLITLTAIAVAVFRERVRPGNNEGPSFNRLMSPDGVLQEAVGRSFLPPIQNLGINDLVAVATAESGLDILAPREGELDPMLLYPGGGSRMSATMVFTGLLSSALLQMYLLRMPWDESTFVRTVLEGFEELQRAVRGERIRAHAVSGIAGITLPEAVQMRTPWGTVRPAPPIETEQMALPLGRPKTRCILAEPRLLAVRFDRAASPKPLDQSQASPEAARVLFPLSCALASKESAKPVAPFVTWSTLVVPFQSAFWFSTPIPPPTLGSEVYFGDRIEQVEHWASVVDRSHVPGVDIAANRLISAVTNRIDRSDSLIDAVMVWENLVGTRSEVTFRVTAAIAKLLESDPTKRRDLRKELSGIYETRSRVVHGSSVERADVDKACSSAIDVAVRALRAAYRKGREWLELSSQERADEILLEWE